MPKRMSMMWRSVLLAAASSLLVACGGGGGSSTAADAPLDNALSGALSVNTLTDATAARFLWKAAFGPSPQSMADVRSMGYAGWIDHQIQSVPAGLYSTVGLHGLGYPIYNVNDSLNPVRRFCARQDLLFGLQGSYDPTACVAWLRGDSSVSAAFFRSAVHDPDQLRLRTAWALSQILVTSTNTLNASGYGMRLYQQLLRDHAFANYREILKQVTLSPYMGKWLDMAGSHKDAPNENYARELLQLFSLGVYELNNDGSYKLSPEGKRIEIYNNDVVQSFARALSGWEYVPEARYSNPLSLNYEGQLQPNNSRHAEGTKVLLAGSARALSTQGSAEQDLEAVLDNIFYHPNIAPYISKQLIQFLVTSNPSPAYVNRVANVFKADQNGVRGNMGAVVKAILLDSEAINAPVNGGRLQEPVVVLAGMMRSIGGHTDGVHLASLAATAGQQPFKAPSVFNFFSFDFLLPLPGSTMNGPEFGLLNLSSTANFSSQLETLLLAGSVGKAATTPTAYTAPGGGVGTNIVWPSAWLSWAQTNSTSHLLALAQAMNTSMAGGVFTQAELNLLANYVSTQPSMTASRRVGLTAFLMLTAPQFLNQR